MAWKKSITTLPFGPSVPNKLPNTRQKNTKPKVFVPDLKWKSCMKNQKTKQKLSICSKFKYKN